MPSRPSLIIVGHGSSSNSAAEIAVEEHAITLRQSRRFGAVLTHFVQKGSNLPPLPNGELFILPFFMSDGFFVRKKIPSIFGLIDGERHSGDRHLVQCDAIGIDPELSQIIDTCVSEVRERKEIRKDNIALLLVAHGSSKSTASREAALLQQEIARRKNIAATVEVAFLEEAPSIEDSLAQLSKRFDHVVIIGLFSANGPHATDDVTQAIDTFKNSEKVPLIQSVTEIYYTGAIGVRPEIVRLIQNSISRKAGEVQ